MPQAVTAILLAAGKGTRMKSDRHKVLHEIGGRPMLAHLLAALDPLAPDRVVCVVGAYRDQLAAAFPQLQCVVQDPQLGTGHAVMAALPALPDGMGDVAVLFGDTPFIPTDVLAELIARRREGDHALAVLGFQAADPAKYGRLVLNEQGDLDRIVEFKDASAAERDIRLCNSGVMVFDGARLAQLMAGIGNDNAAGEYYLTDAVAVARSQGWTVGVTIGPEADMMGVNSRADLARAEAVFQTRRRAQMMAEGVTLIDPGSVFFSHDTEIGADSVVEPHVWFGPGVRVGRGVRIKAFSHLEGVTVAEAAEVGPYARLRPGTRVGAQARIGNFVEVKKAEIGAGAKVSHLSYIGDARVGEQANVGAGTITCNYDGFNKYLTDIGAGAFIGSNSALVAPVKVGAGAIVGAGSVIARDVAEDALALTRSAQTDKPGWAARFRQAKQAAKTKKG